MLAKNSFLITLMLLLAGLIATPMMDQNTVSGDITGIVSDPSGAVLPNTQVTLNNDATSQTQTVNTNAQGVYRFSLLNPGTYTISASAHAA